MAAASAGDPYDWSRDGQYLLFEKIEKTGQDLWVLPMGGGGSGPVPFVKTEANETFGAFSPDNRWIAYASDESGRDEIYVRPFNPPHAGTAPVTGVWMISRQGGTRPRWRRDGKELYFLAPERTVMAVEVSGGSVFRAGVPRLLFSGAANLRHFDAAGDGSRFLVASPAGQPKHRPLTVVMNLAGMLKR